MHQPPQGPGYPPPPPAPGGYPPPPPPRPAPADGRIKGGVRRGQAFADPQDAARAVAYAEKFLKTGYDVSRPPIMLAIAGGLTFTVVVQLTIGMSWGLVVPFSIFLGVLGYLAFWAMNRGRVEQSLAANRQVLGQPGLR